MGIFNKSKKKASSETEEKPAKIEAAKEEKKLATEPKEKKAEAKRERSAGNLVSGILVRPIITERSSSLAAFNQYVFAVKTGVNKIQVAQAIEARYGVKPVRVNLLNNFGKSVRYGRSLGRTKDWKKAIITLPAGKSIQIQEGV